DLRATPVVQHDSVTVEADVDRQIEVPNPSIEEKLFELGRLRAADPERRCIRFARRVVMTLALIDRQARFGVRHNREAAPIDRGVVGIRMNEARLWIPLRDLAFWKIYLERDARLAIGIEVEHRGLHSNQGLVVTLEAL